MMMSLCPGLSELAEHFTSRFMGTVADKKNWSREPYSVNVNAPAYI
jgi:hypothetical protein